MSVENEIGNSSAHIFVPYVPAEKIKRSAQEILELIEYRKGPVDLVKICSTLSIDLQFSKKVIEGEDGTRILGSANFDHSSIQIHVHEDSKQERFTIGHEIGHFRLMHEQYLRSETIAERDLLINSETRNIFNFERLEFQANMFSSELILPDNVFQAAVEVGRRRYDIIDRGHGYIFVDDQPCNFTPYNELLSDLSSYFEISKRAIELKLKNFGFLIDQRKRSQSSSSAQPIGDFISSVSP